MATTLSFTLGDDPTEYPIPTRFRLSDWVLIAELTGYQADEFIDNIREGDWSADPRMILGMVGSAVWQAKPRWSRDRVRAYVENVWQDGFKWITPDQPVPAPGDPDAPQGDVPPTPLVETPSTDSAGRSTSEPDVSSTPQPPVSETTPSDSGPLVSPTGSPG